VHLLNREAGQNVAAYSIDAGFHVFVFCLQQHKPLVMDKLGSIAERLERIIEAEIDPQGCELL
jgi:mevalonate pyrophosphate decarboxylase